MISHAANLTTEKTLCDLPTISNRCGWIMAESGMKINKGQMYSLFLDRVSCETCRTVAKETLLKETCDECGQEI
jgi:hypothetical protein